MFEVNKTRARWAFKDLLGQANHFLITILVGLNGVRSGELVKDEEFSTSWNPKDARRSADRSRVFALDLSLVRAVDALDTYMMSTVREPCALPNSEFVRSMGATKRSVANRLEVFDRMLPSLRPSHRTALEIAIEWRNRRVHSLSDDRVDKVKFKVLKNDADYIKEHFSGLDVDSFISNFKSGVAPTFKEAASIINMCHLAVQHYDAYLLKELDIERYILQNVKKFLSENGSLEFAISKTWGRENSRSKALRILRFAGVSEVDIVKGREVSSDFVDEFVNLPSEKVEAFINR